MSDLGLVRGIIALLTLVTFLSICWWAYRPKNRSRFEADAQLVFADEEEQQRAKEKAEESSVDARRSDREGKQ